MVPTKLTDSKIQELTSDVYELTDHGKAKIRIFSDKVLEKLSSFWDLPYKKFIDKGIEISKQDNIKVDWSFYKMIMARYKISQSMIESKRIDKPTQRINKSYVKQNESQESNKSGRLPVYVPPTIELDYDKECEHFFQAVLDGKVRKGYELSYPPFMGWLERNPERIAPLEIYLGRKIDIKSPETIYTPRKEESVVNDNDLIKEMSGLKEALSNLMGKTPQNTYQSSTIKFEPFTLQDKNANNNSNNDYFGDDPIFFDSCNSEGFNSNEYEEVF